MSIGDSLVDRIEMDESRRIGGGSEGTGGPEAHRSSLSSLVCVSWKCFLANLRVRPSGRRDVKLPSSARLQKEGAGGSIIS